MKVVDTVHANVHAISSRWSPAVFDSYEQGRLAGSVLGESWESFPVAGNALHAAGCGLNERRAASVTRHP
jgi:hypothetical protein